MNSFSEKFKNTNNKKTTKAYKPNTMRVISSKIISSYPTKREISFFENINESISTVRNVVSKIGWWDPPIYTQRIIEKDIEFILHTKRRIIHAFRTLSFNKGLIISFLFYINRELFTNKDIFTNDYKFKFGIFWKEGYINLLTTRDINNKAYRGNRSIEISIAGYTFNLAFDYEKYLSNRWISFELGIDENNLLQVFVDDILFMKKYLRLNEPLKVTNLAIGNLGHDEFTYNDSDKLKLIDFTLVDGDLPQQINS